MSQGDENESEGTTRPIYIPETERKSYSNPDPREFADDPSTTEKPSKPVLTEE